MNGEPITVFVADDVAPVDIEHWLSFDDAVLPDIPPSSDDPHSQTQPIPPDSPLLPLDALLSDLIGDNAPICDDLKGDDAPMPVGYLGDAPISDAPGEQVGVSPGPRLDHDPGRETERSNQIDGAAHLRESCEALKNGIGEQESADLSSLADLWESSMRHDSSTDPAASNEGQIEIPYAGNVFETSNLDPKVPEQACPSPWRCDQPQDVDSAQQHGFAATSSSVWHTLQPDGSRSQVLTFEEASQRLFTATAPAPLQNPSGYRPQLPPQLPAQLPPQLPAQMPLQKSLSPQQLLPRQEAQQQARYHYPVQQQQQQKQGVPQLNIPSDARLPSTFRALSSSSQRLSSSRGGEMGVGGIRGPSADPPSTPPPSKLPRPPDLSSRLAAVLRNINPPRPVSSSRGPSAHAPRPSAPAPRPSFPLAKPGISTAASPAARTPAASPAATLPFASEEDQQRQNQQQLQNQPGQLTYEQQQNFEQQQNQQEQRQTGAPAAARSEHEWGVVQQALQDTMAQLKAVQSHQPHRQLLLQPMAQLGPERPLRVDASGMLPRPMSGAREGMLKQQLMALAEALAVDDSVRWRYFMRKLRREASAEGDTLQRIAFHALEALEARMDGSALSRWRNPMNITVQDSMAVLGHDNSHGVPAFIHLANTAAVHEIFQAFTRHTPPSPTPHPHARPTHNATAQSRFPATQPGLLHPPAPPHRPAPFSAPAPAPFSAPAFRSVRRRRLHIIAIGFYAGPHWINILMRLAAHFSSASPSTNGLAPSGITPGAPTGAATAGAATAGAPGGGSSGSPTTTTSSSTSSSIGNTPPTVPPSGAPSPPVIPPPSRSTPHVKVTAVDFGIIKLQEHPTGLVHLGGEYLEQVASMLGLSLSFHGIETTPHDFHPSQVEVDQGEEVVVLANWGLMVFPDDTVLRSNLRNAVLRWIRDLHPLLLLQIDIDLDANGPFFLSRFQAAFANFSAFVESFDCSMPHAATPRFVAETILARDLMNGVACEGMNRWLRSERLEKWLHRMREMGLEPVAIGADTVAAGREITEAKDGRFRLDVHGESGALQLSWRGVPMIFVAAWR
ncbi:hypothetical protein CLOM_g12273 [Closterium sp. NIES-68]|nr:hypothetical protein CLOM_g12273 [Closterium sp. NIES-68]GJP86544.1 hypothetical protein CLOP_g16555 [Closterium sp. NIES-67]